MVVSPKRPASVGDDGSGAKQPPPGGLALMLAKESEATDLQRRQSPEMGLTQKKLLKASLIFADCLLFSLAVWLVFGEGGPGGAIRICLGVLAIGTGAWLACVAVWL